MSKKYLAILMAAFALGVANVATAADDAKMDDKKMEDGGKHHKKKGRHHHKMMHHKHHHGKGRYRDMNTVKMEKCQLGAMIKAGMADGSSNCSSAMDANKNEAGDSGAWIWVIEGTCNKIEGGNVVQ